MDTLMQWLTNINLLEVLLTVLFTSWITTKNSKRDMITGIQATEKTKQDLIAEIRGQFASAKSDNKKG